MRSATPLALFLFVAANLNAQHEQKITTFDVPNSNGSTYPTAISTSGEIIGGSSGGSFLRKSNGTITIVNFPGTPIGINAGEITGWYIHAGEPPFEAAFVIGTNGVFTTITPPAWDASPSAIGPTGEVVGRYIDTFGEAVHGFFWSPGQGSSTSFDAPVETTVYTTIEAVNSAGEFTGYYTNFRDFVEIPHGVLRQPDGSVKSFDAPNADGGTFPNAINAKGQIAGSWVDSTGHYHGFIRDVDDHFTIVDFPSATETGIVGIDSKGEVAGNYALADNVTHAFVRDPNGTFKTIEVPDSTSNGVSAMNPGGAMTGWFTDAKGTHGWVRKP
jgi:hypothetical protein